MSFSLTCTMSHHFHFHKILFFFWIAKKDFNPSWSLFDIELMLLELIHQVFILKLFLLKLHKSLSFFSLTHNLLVYFKGKKWFWFSQTHQQSSFSLRCLAKAREVNRCVLRWKNCLPKVHAGNWWNINCQSSANSLINGC